MLGISAQAQRKTESSKPIKQGVKGQVLFYEGNHMPRASLPGKESNNNRGTITPVIREILFFELFKRNSSGYFVNPAGARLVKKIQSDQKGFYQVKLPVGKYSVAVKENGSYYANLEDAEGYANPVEVKKGEVTTLNIRITYKAYF